MSWPETSLTQALSPGPRWRPAALGPHLTQSRWGLPSPRDTPYQIYATTRFLLCPGVNKHPVYSAGWQARGRPWPWLLPRRLRSWQVPRGPGLFMSGSLLARSWVGLAVLRKAPELVPWAAGGGRQVDLSSSSRALLWGQSQTPPPGSWDVGSIPPSHSVCMRWSLRHRLQVPEGPAVGGCCGPLLVSLEQAPGRFALDHCSPSW